MHLSFRNASLGTTVAQLDQMCRELYWELLSQKDVFSPSCFRHASCFNPFVQYKAQKGKTINEGVPFSPSYPVTKCSHVASDLRVLPIEASTSVFRILSVLLTQNDRTSTSFLLITPLQHIGELFIIWKIISERFK